MKGLTARRLALNDSYVKVALASLRIVTVFIPLLITFTFLAWSISQIGKSPEISQWIIFFCVLKIIIAIYASGIINYAKTHKASVIIDEFAKFAFLINFYILLFISILSPLHEDHVRRVFWILGLPRSPAYYLTLIMTLIIAYFLKGRKGGGAGDEPLYVIRYAFETVAVIITIVTLASSRIPYLELEFFRPAEALVQMICIFAISAVLLYGLEAIVDEVSPTPSKLRTVIYVSRKVYVFNFSIAIGVILFIAGLVNAIQIPQYFIEFENIESTFVFLAFLSISILLGCIAVGVYAGTVIVVSDIRTGAIASPKVVAVKPVVTPALATQVRTSEQQLQQPQAPEAPQGPPQTQPQPQTQVRTSEQQLQQPQAPEAPQGPPQTQPQPQTQSLTMEAKSCPFCGGSLPERAKFCPYCGACVHEEEGTRIYAEGAKKES